MSEKLMRAATRPRKTVAGRVPRRNPVSGTPYAKPSAMLGQSPVTSEVEAQIVRAASCDLIVLLGGESGAGKNYAAEQIHAKSARRKRPFVKVPAGIPDSLLEAELFGHEKGAFTGAQKLRRGYFERASGGTIFFEEVGDLSEAAQRALLGVVERGTFYRIGGEEEVTVDVRVLAATWRDLCAMVDAGHFRHDLYHRLAVLSVQVAPLRERGEAAAAIAADLLGHAVSPSDRAALLAHDWPGNVRELENVTDLMKQLGLTAEQAIAEVGRLALPAPGRPAPGQPAPGRPAPGRPAPGRPAPGQVEPIDSALCALFAAVRARGVQKVADMIGMPRGTLAKKLNGQRPLLWTDAKRLAAAVGMEIRIG